MPGSSRIIDGCIWAATSGGTGSFVESAAVFGYQTMEVAGALDQQQFSYRAQLPNNTQWEIGFGIWTASTKTLTRFVLFNSSGGTSPINFTGPPQILITALATDFFPIPANGNLDFYVDGVAGSDNNPGTISQPFATPQRAFNVAGLYDYQSNWFPTIHTADATYPNTGAPPELPDLVNCLVNAVFQGNTTTPGNCILWDVNQNSCLTASVGARWIVRGFRFDSPVIAILMDNYGSYIQLNSNNEWTDRTNGGAQTFISSQFGSEFDLRGTLSVLTNTFGRFAFLFEWALVQLAGVTINFQPSTVMNQFVSLLNWCRYVESGSTYNNMGSMTGLKFLAGNFSTIQTSDGTDAHLGGNTNDGGDATSQIVGAVSQGTFLTQNAGLPGVANIAQTETWAVFKDTTSGARAIVANDNGVIYVRQIGNNINHQTGTTYTFALADQEGIVEMDNAAANTATVPLNATVAFPIGTKITVVQQGAGATTIAAAGGVTVHNAGALTAQFKSALLYKRATDEWSQINGAF